MISLSPHHIIHPFFREQMINQVSKAVGKHKIAIVQGLVDTAVRTAPKLIPLGAAGAITAGKALYLRFLPVVARVWSNIVS